MVRIARTKAAEVEESYPAELPSVIAQIGKNYGNNTIRVASEVKQPWRIPTGIFSFDLATLGGIPYNRWTMFHGARSSGKTTAAEKVIAGVQRSLPDQQAVFLNVEGTRDAEWGAKLGVDNSRLLIVDPDSGEHAVDMADALIRTREVSLVVVDSIAALTPMREIDSSAEDAHVGLQSRMVSAFTRKVNSALIAERKRGHFVTILVINQQRSAIGKWAPHGQEALSLPGGKALEFVTTLQCQFKNKENISKDKDGFDMLEFNEHAFKLDKNKMNGGIRAGEYQLMRRDSQTYKLFEGDIDDAGTMLAHAKKIGCYTGGGKSWTLDIPGLKTSVANVDQMISQLYEDRERYWKLRNHLIADHAARLGMPEYFIEHFYK